MEQTECRPIVNQVVVLREEFDDWGVLFDPDTGEAFGIDPIGIDIWKKLNGKNTLEEITVNLKKEYDDMPESGPVEIKEFVDELIDKGLVGFEV